MLVSRRSGAVNILNEKTRRQRVVGLWYQPQKIQTPHHGKPPTQV